MAGERLQKLRISRRCYTLLNLARVKPENLPAFYRTYRLPDDAFFPLFLAVKSKWLDDRRKWKEKRRGVIEQNLKKLPEQRIEEMEMLAILEKNQHPGGQSPLWAQYFLPKSIKRTREMSDYSELDWQNLYSLFLGRLAERYRNFSPNDALRCEALLLLGFDLHHVREKPEKRDVSKRFRRLSGKYHPDRGGDAAVFRRLKTARDILI